MKIPIILMLCLCLATQGLYAQKEKNYLENPLPQAWSDGDFFEQTLPADDLWWQRFDDPLLDTLITIATERNYSVLSAMANMRDAKASWRIAQAVMLPSIDLSAGWQRSKSSGNLSDTGDTESWSGYYNAGLSMSWQADIFGKLYKRSKAQKELFHASEEEYRGVIISLCANVATTYFSLLKSIAEMNVLRENVASQKEIMNIVEVRYNTGLASKLDVAQARSVYYSTLASIPTMEAAIEQYRNALAVLLATYPSEFETNINDSTALPDYIEPVSVGLPAALLRRRPDVRSAERNVEASAALLGAAKRDWLPEFYLNGSVGYASSDIKYLPRARSATWEIAPSITWNLFAGGSTLNAQRQAQAQLDKNIAEFNSTVLTAMREVENAMSTYRNSIAQIVALRETVNQSEETLKLSLELYKQGLTQFQNVLDAQRTLLSYQDQLVQAKGNSLISLVQLYEALGGGW